MRGLVKDNNRKSSTLTASNTNANNNNATLAANKSTVVATTTTTTASASTTGTNALKNSHSNKTFKMQQQQLQQQQHQSQVKQQQKVKQSGSGSAAAVVGGTTAKQAKLSQQASSKQKQQQKAANENNNVSGVAVPQSSSQSAGPSTGPAAATSSPAATTISTTAPTTTSSPPSSTATATATSTSSTLPTTIALPKACHANTNEELAGGVQDTIYLCNFRVSVDGDWLCLKELQDLDIGASGQGQHGMLTAGNMGSTAAAAAAGQRSGSGSGSGAAGSAGASAAHKLKRFSGLSAASEDNGILAFQKLLGRSNRFISLGDNVANNHQLTHLLFANITENCTTTNTNANSGNGGDCWSQHLLRDPSEIERSNLVNICKLVVKELLEQSLRYGRMLDSDHLPLQHFFIVIEHVLGHGLKPKKGLLGPRKELWDLLQSVENYCPEAQDITMSVRDLPTVRTHIGRARAWLRIALMQKKLADYLQALIEHRDDSLYEYYEPYALMMSDEIVIIMGILVGLNVIDCNLCVKEEDLDSQQGVIDFSLYLRSSSRDAETEEELNNTQNIDVNDQGNMIAVLDQKNYIEELNRHLNATVGNLQAKVESLTTTNALMKEDLAIARNSLLALQAENASMRQNANATRTTNSSLQSDASSNTSASSDKVTNESLSVELNEEKKKNAELEKELKLQVSLKAESDMAMKLLEKDIHEKQDTIISLRRQLDDIKQINLEMYRKLQECEDELTQKGEMVSRLQTKAFQIGNILQSLERKYESKLEQNTVGSTGNGSSSLATKSPTTRRQQNLLKFEALTKKCKQDMGPPMKRLHLKMDGIPPFNPNLYRKSPATATAPGTALAPAPAPDVVACNTGNSDMAGGRGNSVTTPTAITPTNTNTLTTTRDAEQHAQLTTTPVELDSFQQQIDLIKTPTSVKSVNGIIEQHCMEPISPATTPILDTSKSDYCLAAELSQALNSNQN